jgi:hypothetical protein
MIETIKKDFPVKFTSDLVESLGVSQRTIIRKARELNLVKIEDFKKINQSLINEKISKNLPENPNKGKKGYYSPGCEKGWFNSGNTPHNYLPVGTEITDSMGYLKIKTADPNTWKFKHKLMYLENHGSIPNDHIIIFLDNDKLNIDITNLKAITKQEHMEMIRSGLRTYDSELTEVGINVAKLKVKTFEKIKNKNTK